jgi:GMP synthase (glutamine-hydrolysing)
MSVHDTDAHPWLAGERSLLADAVEMAVPVLGIGLGAQQLALALGAQVAPGSPESGVGEVVLTADGRRDPVLGPEYGGLATTSVPCVHWHRDTFSLPARAVHLAASRGTPHQAFRYGSRAYGFQFHIEVDSNLAQGWSRHLPEGVVLEGVRLTHLEIVGRRLTQRFAAAAR